MSKQNMNTSHLDTLVIIKNKLEMRKLQPPKIQGSKTQKNIPSNITKADLQTPKKFLVCCFVIFRAKK